MNYTRKFNTVAELDDYVDFQERENDLRFEWDRISKKCRIEVDEGMYQSLKEMELYEGRQNK